MAILDWNNYYRGHTLMTVVALSTIISYVYCPPTGGEEQHEDPVRITRYKDVPEAINYLRESMADEMSKEERCKRYAVLLMLASNNIPYEKTVSHLAVLPEDVLDKHLRKTDGKKLSSLYMSAIDKYRVSQLDNAFLDLIDCLSQIDSPVVHAFMEDPELILIKDHYRRLLDRPDVVFDLASIDFGAFHPAFRMSFQLLFRGHVKGESCQDEYQLQNSPIRPPSGTDEPNSDRPSQQQPAEDLPQKAEEDVTAEERQSTLKRKRECENERIRLEEETHRHRERDRLRQRRLRLLRPSEMRIRERERQQRRRNRLREQLVAADIAKRRYEVMDMAHYVHQRSRETAFGQSPKMDQRTIDLIGQRWQGAAPTGPVPTYIPILESTMQQQQRKSTFRDLSSFQPSILNTSSTFQSHRQPPAQKVIAEHRFPILNTTLPLKDELRARQTLFRPQPLVRPLTSSVPIPKKNQQASSLHDLSSYDRLLSLPSDLVGSRQPLSGNTAFKRFERNHTTETTGSGERSSRMSTWTTLDPRTRAQSDDLNDLTNSANHLDDTEALVYPIVNQIPRAPTPATSSTRDSFFEADAELANPWYDFDRRFRTKDD